MGVSSRQERALENVREQAINLLLTGLITFDSIGRKDDVIVLSSGKYAIRSSTSRH